MSLYLSEAEKQLAAIDQPAKLHEAFEGTGITWNNRAEALADFRQGREIVYEDGEPQVRYDGEFLHLKDALLRFGYDRRDLIDGRSLPKTGIGTARSGQASKADFETLASKVAYIREFGEDSWAKLPMKAPTGNGEVLTQEDFAALPRAEKVRRIRLDPDCNAKLPRSAVGRSAQQGITHHEALAKHVASRGAH